MFLGLLFTCVTKLTCFQHLAPIGEKVEQHRQSVPQALGTLHTHGERPIINYYLHNADDNTNNDNDDCRSGFSLKERRGASHHLVDLGSATI